MNTQNDISAGTAQTEIGTTPLCPSCSRPMQFVRAVPRFAALPELRTYECKACGVTYTEAVEVEGEHDIAWLDERPRT
jgi:rubredoxin